MSSWMKDTSALDALTRQVAETAQRHASAAEIVVRDLVKALEVRQSRKIARRIRPLRGPW